MSDEVGGATGLSPEAYAGAVERLAAEDPVLVGVVIEPTAFLAAAVAEGTLDLARLALVPDDEVRRALVALRGMGRWTADVDPLFALRSPDA